MTSIPSDISAAQAQARADELISQIVYFDLDRVEEFFDLAVEYRLLALELRILNASASSWSRSGDDMMA